MDILSELCVWISAGPDIGTDVRLDICVSRRNTDIRADISAFDMPAGSFLWIPVILRVII